MRCLRIALRASVDGVAAAIALVSLRYSKRHLDHRSRAMRSGNAAWRTRHSRPYGDQARGRKMLDHGRSARM